MLPDRRAPVDRGRADQRRDPRHERLRDRPVADRRRVSGSSGSARSRTASRSSTAPSATRSSRVDLVVSTGGLGPTPDDLTRESIAAVCGRDARPSTRISRRWLRGAVGPPGAALPRDQPQAGLADPVRDRAAQRRTGRRRAGSSTGRTAGSSSPCPVRPARCARCGTTRSCPGSASRGLGVGPGGPDPAPHRDRRVDGRRPARRGAPPPGEPRGGDLRPGRGGRRPALGDGRTGRPRTDPAAPPRRSSTRSRRSSCAKLGDHVWARGETTWADVIGDGARPARLDAGRPRDRHRRDPRRAPRRRRPGSTGWSRSVPGDAARAGPTRCRGAPRSREAGRSDVGLRAIVRPRGADTLVSIGIVTPRGDRPLHGAWRSSAASRAGCGPRSSAAARLAAILRGAERAATA